MKELRLKYATLNSQGTSFLPSFLPTILAIFIALFVFVTIMLLTLPRIINYLAKRYTGRDINIDGAVGEVQAITIDVTDIIIDYTLAKANPELRNKVRKSIPTILHFLVFSRLRTSGTQLLIAVFVAIGGLIGTILLYNQNELLSSQNELLLKQNEKIDNQILLDEAARRSSLNFLLGNVLDQINEELSDPNNNKRRLSPQLIGRIASLSQSFQPYYFMEEGKMTSKPVSPERGNLLLALVNSELDTFTLDLIYKKTIFKDSYLEGAIIDSVYLRNVDLQGANLKGAYLVGANLEGADLFHCDLSETVSKGANFSSAFLSEANLQNATLIDADFSGTRFITADPSPDFSSSAKLSKSMLIGANFSYADLRGCDLSYTNLSKATLEEANLEGADLKDIKGLDHPMLRSCYRIFGVRNLSEALAVPLHQEIEIGFHEQ